MKPSPGVALAEPLVRGGACAVLHDTVTLPDGRAADHLAVRLVDGTELLVDVCFKEDPK